MISKEEINGEDVILLARGAIAARLDQAKHRKLVELKAPGLMERRRHMAC
jgi:hypothetical protein